MGNEPLQVNAILVLHNGEPAVLKYLLELENEFQRLAREGSASESSRRHQDNIIKPHVDFSGTYESTGRGDFFQSYLTYSSAYRLVIQCVMQSSWLSLMKAGSPERGKWTWLPVLLPLHH